MSCSQDKICFDKYVTVKSRDVTTNYTDTNYMFSDKLNASQLDSKTLTASVISTDKAYVGGVDVSAYQNGASRSVDYSFDQTLPNGIFGDRTPVKPPTVNSEVFNAMLVQLKDNVIPDLCERFNKGRKRLGLPAVPTDPNILGSISVPILFRAFPDAETEAERKLFRYNLSLGWDVQLANIALPLTSENKPSCVFTGSVSGNVLTVTEVDFGIIEAGTALSALGLPNDIVIYEQLLRSNSNESYFRTGTYRLAKVIDDVRHPEDVNLNLSSREFTGTVPLGLRLAGIYIQYGYIDKETEEVVVKMYDLGIRQFNPTIDFDPTDDPFAVESWGEKYQGYRSITADIGLLAYENMPNLDDTACIQLVIIREAGLVALSESDTEGYRAIAASVAGSIAANTIAASVAGSIAASTAA